MSGASGRARADRRPVALSAALLGPPTLLVAAMLVAPVLLLLWNSVTTGGPGEVGSPPLSLSNYGEILTDPRLLRILQRTIVLSACATALACAVAVPIALVVVFTRSRALRAFYVIAAISPLLISIVLRAFGWQVLLGAGGPVADVLTSVFGDNYLRGLLGTDLSTVIGMAHQMVPFVLLGLIPTLDKLDTNAVRASENLGSSRVRTFWTVVLPLARPGLLAGAVICLALGTTAFVTPTLMGGRSNPVFSMVVYDENFRFFRWSFGAAAALIMLATVLLLATAVGRLGRLRLGRRTSRALAARGRQPSSETPVRREPARSPSA